jgi:uncharacterized membrane protein
MARESSSGKRFAFLDWTRGLATCIMLQGHVFHSFTHTSLRGDGPYQLSQFFGGMTPAIFLFLTGVTYAFLLDSQSRKQPVVWRRVVAALYRARYLLLIGLAFRFELCLTSFDQTSWTNFFKVDILNCMAISMLVLASMAMLTTLERIRFATVAGFLIAALSPLVTQIGFTGLHPFLRHYIVPDFNFFPLFPWGAFVAFGVAAGSVLRITSEEMLPRVMQWATMVGLAFILAGHYCAELPFVIGPPSDYWLNSPWLIVVKTGVILLMGSWAYLYTTYLNPNGWSFVRQLGTTSLLVYWVHTELVYGRWLGAWKESLTVPQTVLMAIYIIAAMVLLSVAKTGWKGFPGAWSLVKERLPRLGWSTPLPGPAAGD